MLHPMKIIILLVAAFITGHVQAQTGIVVYKGTAAERVQQQGPVGVVTVSSLAFLIVDYDRKEMGYVMTNVDKKKGATVLRHLGTFSIAEPVVGMRNLITLPDSTAKEEV
jgi:hypothetical protein